MVPSVNIKPSWWLKDSIKESTDYSETFSPVIKPITVRIILTIDPNHKWSIKKIDINNAFLNGFLEEEMYMTQP